MTVSVRSPSPAFLLITFALISLNVKQLFAEPADDAIVKIADKARGPESAYSSNIQVDDTADGETKTAVYRVCFKGTHFTLVEQTEPSRLRGRKLLMQDQDLWLFTPNTSRPTRISFEQKLTGEVSNGDLMRTNFAEDYSATKTAEELVDGVKCYKFHLVAKNKNVTYRSIDYWISVDKKYPVKALFFAVSGKPLKTAEYTDFRPVFGRPAMNSVRIKDALHENRVSTIRYSKQRREKLADEFFSKENLGQ